jgi:hypothetical protein
MKLFTSKAFLVFYIFDIHLVFLPSIDAFQLTHYNNAMTIMTMMRIIQNQHPELSSSEEDEEPVELVLVLGGIIIFCGGFGCGCGRGGLTDGRG